MLLHACSLAPLNAYGGRRGLRLRAFFRREALPPPASWPPLLPITTEFSRAPPVDLSEEAIALVEAEAEAAAVGELEEGVTRRTSYRHTKVPPTIYMYMYMYINIHELY